MKKWKWSGTGMWLGIGVRKKKMRSCDLLGECSLYKGEEGSPIHEQVGEILGLCLEVLVPAAQASESEELG